MFFVGKPLDNASLFAGWTGSILGSGNRMVSSLFAESRTILTACEPLLSVTVFPGIHRFGNACRFFRAFRNLPTFVALDWISPH